MNYYAVTLTPESMHNERIGLVAESVMKYGSRIDALIGRAEIKDERKMLRTVNFTDGEMDRVTMEREVVNA